MKFTFRRTPFYFLRHGETDHNVHGIYDDFTEIHLNENGKKQALEIHKIFRSIPIITVCSSPLLRVQQTKNIVLENKSVQDIILDELRECPSALWRLFLAAEIRELTIGEWDLINEFTYRVKNGLEKALEYNAPILLIAHGGTYWALAHLLHLQGDPKIGNCVLTHIIPEGSKTWRAEPILME
ncbi:MAG: histidine phosphatase family protein [Candidatus Rhabdochlamydia sp.]